MLGLLLGGPIRALLSGPLAMLSSIIAIVAICGCMRCMRCRMRDCSVMKRLFRWINVDTFDDFELMVLVHEAMFDKVKSGKCATMVRITAGSHTVRTDKNSHSVFQQPVHITVEQGADLINIELLDSHTRVLATLQLDTYEDILRPGSSLKPETVFMMTEKNQGIRNPRIMLTIVCSQEDDEIESGLLGDTNSDVNILVRQQLRKAREQGKKSHREEGEEEEDLSEMEILKQACCGPLEVFEGLGKTHTIYVALVGPPVSRRWILGIWRDQNDFIARKTAMIEVDLLKIESVQGDPTRNHVFVISHYDKSRSRQNLTFRRIDRARDVWVEILTLLVVKARETTASQKAERKSGRKSDGTDTGTTAVAGGSRSQTAYLRSAYGAR